MAFKFVPPEKVVEFVEQHPGCTAEDVDTALHLKNAYTRLLTLAAEGKVHCEEFKEFGGAGAGPGRLVKHWHVSPASKPDSPGNSPISAEEDLRYYGGLPRPAPAGGDAGSNDGSGGEESPGGDDPADRDGGSTAGTGTAKSGPPGETPTPAGIPPPPRAGRPPRSDNRLVPLKDRALAVLAKIAPRGCSLKGLATALKAKTANLSGPLAKLCEGDQVHCAGAGTRGSPYVYYSGPAPRFDEPPRGDPAPGGPAVLTTDNGVRASLVAGPARILIEVPLHCPEPDVRRAIRLLETLLEPQLEEE